MRVVFDLDQFAAAYPHCNAAALSHDALQALWEAAVGFVGDDDSNSFAPYDPENGIIERRLLLQLVLSHLIQMQAMSANSGGLSGRITSASQGSISISVEAYQANSMTAQFWTQTNDGALYWMLTTKYRLGGRLYANKEHHPFA